MIEDTIELS